MRIIHIEASSPLKILFPIKEGYGATLLRKNALQGYTGGMNLETIDLSLSFLTSIALTLSCDLPSKR